MTHLHLDHSSAISEFPTSTFVVSEAEWQAASHGPNPLLNGYRRAHFDFAFDYRTVDFDRANIDSYATFGLFGDGSIRLAFTPGHSAGHMSLICRLQERDFVISGDAIYVETQLDGSDPPAPRPQDAHNARRSPPRASFLPPPVPRRGDHPRARSGLLCGCRSRVSVVIVSQRPMCM
jgi:glyoxylase-like metal-dependent hydrolase (beta-lactamase superfamily II)